MYNLKGGVVVTKEVAELQKIIDNHDNIVFFGAPEYQPKAASLTSGVKTGYITRNTNTHRRQS